MTSDEEDDYMSDTFLKKSVPDAKTSLVSYSEKRKIAAIERKKLHDELNRKKHPSIKIMELNFREEALNKPIEESNKGFTLLQKMGYKPGTGIGKTEGSLKEPISFSLKNDRQGLGNENKMEKFSRYKQMTKQGARPSQSTSINEYRTRVVQTFSKRRLGKDLQDSQRACQNLDTMKGHTKPLCSWYWLETFDDSEEDNIDSNDDLDDHRTSVRGSDDEDDIDDECNDRSNRYNSSDEYNSDDDGQKHNKRKKYGNENSEHTEDSAEDIEKKLRILTAYLRETYFYCVWCGVEFTDEKDMQTSCPGDTNDDH